MEEQEEEDEGRLLEITFTIRIHEKVPIPQLVEEVRQLDGVKSVRVD